MFSFARKYNKNYKSLFESGKMDFKFLFKSRIMKSNIRIQRNKSVLESKLVKILMKTYTVMAINGFPPFFFISLLRK